MKSSQSGRLISLSSFICKKCDALMKYIKLYYDEEDFDWLFKQLDDTDVKHMLFKKDSEQSSQSDMTLKKIKTMLSVDNH